MRLLILVAYYDSVGPISTRLTMINRPLVNACGVAIGETGLWAQERKAFQAPQIVSDCVSN